MSQLRRVCIPLAVVCVAVTGVVAWELRRAGAVSEDVAGSQPIQNDVALTLMQLLRTQDITPEVFTNPTTQPTKWDFGGGSNTPLNWSNWNGTRAPEQGLSYRYDNPFATSSTKSGTDSGK